MLDRLEPAPSSWEELFEAAKRRASRAASRRRRDRLASVKGEELSRIRAASEYVSRKLTKVALSMPFLDSLHPFYRELLLTMIDENTYKVCLSRIRSVARLVRRIAVEAAREVRASSEEREARKARKAFFGRLQSLLESLDECFRLIRGWQGEIAKLPSIDPTLPSIVIAGAPNVGKSSLLRAISRAKPEVKPYPFTTTNVIVGHLELANTRVQAIDTPGLLDRPLSEKGPIERRAVSALKHLRGVTVFLFDPTLSCGFPLDFQMRVYNEVEELLGGGSLILVANKVDITTPEQASQLVRMLGDKAKNLVFISALTGIGLDYLLERVETELLEVIKM
ncbi:MAG: GTPase [Thermofilaceae archaeon]